MSRRVRRACDACRVRKVRCGGGQPCAQCAHLNLSCAFAPSPEKRKPAIRGRLVAQLRRGHAPDPSPSPPSAPVTSIAGIVHAGHAPEPRLRFGGPLPPPSPSPSISLDNSPFSIAFFIRLLPDFERLVYPVNPVLTPDEMRAAIGNMHADVEDFALVHAFGAVTINLTQTSWTSQGDVAAQMKSLIYYSLWAHRRVELGLEADPSGLRCTDIPVTVKRIMTCIFNEISLMAFKRIDRSLALIREAIAMIQILNIHQYADADVDNRGTLSAKETARRQRMYWEAYIHERFLCTVSGFPCVLAPLRSDIDMVADDSVPLHVIVGFRRLILLFRIMDGPFLAHYSAQHDPSQVLPGITAHWIESKQAQLDQDEVGAAEAEHELATAGHGTLTELQHADLFVTRLWLRTLLWQLALSRGLLRSDPHQHTHEGLSLHFPVQRLSAQLRSLVGRLESVASIVIHGSGILQKLFEITSTVADVLALPGGHGHTQQQAHLHTQDFFFLVRFLFGFERTEKHQRAYLKEKLLLLRQLYPTVDFAGLE